MKTRSTASASGWLIDLDSGKVSEWLVALRADRRVIQLPVGQAESRLAELVQLLGVTRGSITAALRRHGRTAAGAGPASRHPGLRSRPRASRCVPCWSPNE